MRPDAGRRQLLLRGADAAPVAVLHALRLGTGLARVRDVVALGQMDQNGPHRPIREQQPELSRAALRLVPGTSGAFRPTLP